MAADPDKRSWMDGAGMIASAVCAVHCVVGALAPGIVALGVVTSISHEAEWALTLLAGTFALAAGGIGWRDHRSPWPLPFFAVGLLALLSARLSEASGIEGLCLPFSLVAAAALVLGHVSNLHASRRHTHPRAESR